MRNVFYNILIASVILSLAGMPVMVSAMPEPVPATQTDKQKAAAQRQKEAEKRKKEAEKAKAAREKQKAADAKKREAEKRKAAAAKANEQKRAEQAKANEKAQAQRDKEAAERAKAAAEREEARAKREAEAKAKEEKAVRDYEKYQANLAHPKTEVVSYFNLGLRLGYAAMMDKLPKDENGAFWGAGTLNQSNALQQLVGGPGVGLDFTYNLEYGHFLFETGLDFRYLNSTSRYGFTATRTDNTYGAKYNYLFDRLTENRNLFEIGVPVMLGAQFSRYYFLVGAKVHYGLPLGYTQKGQYDITVNDPALLEPYGMGIHSINGQTGQPMKFGFPDLSIAAEVGLDLDEWLQQQPRTDKNAKKKQQQVKAGQRLPFGREHIHYRVALFAEYGVLNTNKTPNALPAAFDNNDVEVSKTNTLLAMNGSKLNNLFVGAKFTVQFEVPGKKARPLPPPSAYAIYTVVDENTNEPLRVAFVETRGTESGKIAMREKQIGPKGFKQKHAVGSFTAEAKADGYYPAKKVFEVEKVGSTTYVQIALKPCPIFRVRVYNKETGQPVPATVQILQRESDKPSYNVVTDSTTGAARQVLAEGLQYKLHIAQLGYDTVDLPIAAINDSMNVALTPIKKGEVFVIKNLFFATNKTRILPTSEKSMNDLFMYLSRNPQVRIKIIGHTDSVGKDEANQKLSDGRANAVMNDLIERGIAPDRLKAEGRGEKQPVDTNDTPEGRQNNRRVEIEIL